MQRSWHIHTGQNYYNGKINKDEKSIDNLTTKDIATAASKGDETAIEIFELSGKYLGKGLSILIDILNPQRIVIGSVYARNPQLFEKACKEIIDQEALKPARDVCEIVPAALGDQIGDPSEGKHPIIAVRLLLKVW